MPTGGNRERDDADAEWQRLVSATWSTAGDREHLDAILTTADQPTRRQRRHRRRPSEPGSTKTFWIVLVVLPLLLGVKSAAPHVAGWWDYLANGDPTFRVGAGAPVAAPKDGRVRPAVPLPDRPSDDSYAFTALVGSDDPVTFDPCQAIHYVIHDPYAVGDAGRDVIADAVAEVSDATGLAFVFDGFTDEKPSPSRGLRMPQYERQWAPVLISWSDPKETPRLAGDVVGLGGPRESDRPATRRTWVSGAVALDTPDLAGDLASSWGRDTVRMVVVHELGHVLGARHPDSGGQLMSATSGSDSLQDGDRYSFAKLGRGPCLR